MINIKTLFLNYITDVVSKGLVQGLEELSSSGDRCKYSIIKIGENA